MSRSADYFRPEILNKISRLELRARHVVEGFVSGMHRSPYRGFSVEFANHRAYTPGDDVKHIDWRVYAKADRYFIKEYEEETNMRVQVLLDCSGSMGYPEHPGTGRMTKWEYAGTLAASLAYLLVHQRDAVGLTLFDRRIRGRLPTSANRASLAAFAATIESNRPQEGTDLNAAWGELSESIARRGMVVILSDLLADVSDIMRGLQRFRHDRHDVIVLHVLDNDELEFPFTDRMLFAGMEGGDPDVLTDPQQLRGSYLDAMRDFISAVRGACLDNRIDYALISTGDAMDMALTKFLAARLRRQRART